jgi:hypothetical protein
VAEACLAAAAPMERGWRDLVAAGHSMPLLMPKVLGFGYQVLRGRGVTTRTAHSEALIVRGTGYEVDLLDL